VSEIKRKKGEPFEVFLRRVKQEWQRSGKLLQAKKVQFFDPPKSKNIRRQQAISRSKIIAKTEYLKKIGRLSEETDQFGRDRRNKRGK